MILFPSAVYARVSQASVLLSYTTYSLTCSAIDILCQEEAVSRGYVRQDVAPKSACPDVMSRRVITAETQLPMLYFTPPLDPIIRPQGVSRSAP